MQISRHWRMNEQRYTLTGSKEGDRYFIQPPASQVMTEKERWEKKKVAIQAENPVDPRVQMEKELGLPSGSVILINGMLVLADSPEVARAA